MTTRNILDYSESSYSQLNYAEYIVWVLMFHCFHGWYHVNSVSALSRPESIVPKRALDGKQLHSSNWHQLNCLTNEQAPSSFILKGTVSENFLPFFNKNLYMGPYEQAKTVSWNILFSGRFMWKFVKNVCLHSRWLHWQGVSVGVVYADRMSVWSFTMPTLCQRSQWLRNTW